MLNWVDLLAHAVWVAGCMLALAILGISQWKARVSGVRLRDELKQPTARIMLLAAAILFSLGMLSTAATWFERISWGVLVVVLGSQAWLVYRRWRRRPTRKSF